ncbi:MAG: Fic family protein [Alphaproteobacteria bacterium]|nr:Fic family protein [Alphaproteobacteria bacterium]MBP9777267.1 Fic family protein [Alphaproteobacteria bacterium]
MHFGIFQEITSGGEAYKVYIPGALPPKIKLEPFYALLDQANQGLGKLDAMNFFLPDANLFIYLYVRKEALLSSQIEGTQSSLADLFLVENNKKPSVPLSDVEEVTNYVAAINYGINKIQKENFPVSLRLIREIHTILMRGVRGQDKNPGEFRYSQNWIGGTRPGNAIFVPPPPQKVIELMGDLEVFIHSKGINLPLLIKIAMIHLQFESIHPFLDGNGRLGRLLVTLLLCEKNLIKQPIFYLSYFFKKHRAEYYKLLQKVREENDWDKWIKFFLQGVIETSQDAFETAMRLTHLMKTDLEKIRTLGKASKSVERVFTYLQRKPIIGIPELSSSLKLSPHTIKLSLDYLEALGVIKEITGLRRGMTYTYDKYLSILREGDEPL